METFDKIHELCVDKTSCKQEKSLQDKYDKERAPNNNPDTEHLYANQQKK